MMRFKFFVATLAVVALSTLASADNPRAGSAGKGSDAKLEADRAMADDLAKKARSQKVFADLDAKEAAIRAEAAREKAKMKADLDKALADGEAAAAATRAKRDAELGGPGALAKLEAELNKEATPAQYAEVEQALNLHPKELLRSVELSYQDDKLTVFEVQGLIEKKEQIEKLACIARTKAKIQELKNAQK